MLYHAVNALRQSLFVGASLSLCLYSTTAMAQEKVDKPTTDAAPDDYHDRTNAKSAEIVVTAQGIGALDVLAGTSVVSGAELQLNMAGQVGEILAKLPGVSASGFAPGVSRPVLRGFSGERVKVLVDGIGAIDASNTSADHAVSIDPLTAERIEVLRGPAVMLYGSQAIGGAVNVIDKRIPLRPLGEHAHIDALLGADTGADLREAGASIDLPAGGKFVLHADGSYHESGNLTVPGYIAAPILRNDLLAEANTLAGTDPARATELRDAANLRGTLPDSSTRTFSGNAGFAFFEGGSSLGAAVGIYDTQYGVPSRPGGSESGISIALRQKRADFRSELDLGDGFLKAAHTRFGYSDYTHSELTGDTVGTTFNVKGFETRTEIEQAERGTWQGSFGGQYYYRDFEAIGDEAYIAPNTTEQYALFALQEVGIGPVDLQFAGRYEHSSVAARSLGFDRGYDSFSGALSLSHETDGGIKFGVNGSRAERAPTAEEMLADGAHIATQAFEIGEQNLTTERALGAEVFLRGNLGPATVNIAAFKSWFSDYIFLEAAGTQEEGLPVYQYKQGAADYSGFEGEVNLPLIDTGSVKFLSDFRGDYIRANLKDGTPLPRIPPFSLMAALEAQTDHFDLRTEVQWNGAQNRTAPLEKPTDSFTFVNASIAWKPLGNGKSLTLLLQADNIFDVDGRRAASFTKDFVPLPGRNFKLSARTSF